MQPTNRSVPRLVELGAIVAVIAIPIALIVATWEPLEPLPRTNRATTAEHDVPGEDAVEPDDAREREARNDAKATPATPVSATPP